jgi:NSS family neurotransmitter:Na+ symporter
VLSFNVWAAWRPLAWLPGLSSLTVFDALDHLASNVLLPLGGVILAVFGGWVVPARLLVEQLGLSQFAGRALVILLRYVVPLGITAASLLPLGLLLL